MAQKASDKENYRDLRSELDEILLNIRSGELDIDEASEQYERARTIASKLEKLLKTAENKVTKIKDDLF